MKKIAFIMFLTLITVSLYANENWIKIETADKTSKQDIKTDVNISQIEPLNNLVKSATVIKQLIDYTKKEKESLKEKNWFMIKAESSI